MDTDQMMLTAVCDDPAAGLRAVAALRRLADRLERQHVMAARIAGWSWQEIGDALGVSRQAVHKKHGRN
jgi:DNA-directed RNA polymerase specialized sigma24 family protein